MDCKYEKALGTAWNELNLWTKIQKITPTCEEEIECFLYHIMVRELEDARYIKPKIGRKNQNKKQHFPDFILGENEDIVVEIKFSYSSPGDKCKQAGIGYCINDVEKMRIDYPNARRYFILFETSAGGLTASNLKKYQFDKLQGTDKECKIWLYPPNLRENMNSQEKAWETRVSRNILKSVD